jgi:lipopolysaccharide export system permease protein
MLFHSSIRKELTRSFGATLVVLFTIVLTMMLIRTLGQASSGKVNPQEILLILGYTVMGRMPTLLTLALFVSIVSTLSRMYRDSEMTIWLASGQSLRHVLVTVLRFIWPMVLIIGALQLFVWPWSNQQIAQFKERFERRSDLDRVAPGQFRESSDGRRVFFIEKDALPGTGRNVFVYSLGVDGSESITSAQSGRLEWNKDRQFLLLSDGQRLDIGTDGQSLTLSEFKTYGVEVNQSRNSPTLGLPTHARDTLDLLAQPSPVTLAELGWRIGLIITAINLSLLAVAITHSNPRAAKGGQLMTALFAFAVYYNMVNVTRSWVAAGNLDVWSGTVALHLPVLLLSLLVLWLRQENLRLRDWLVRKPLPTKVAT